MLKINPCIELISNIGNDHFIIFQLLKNTSAIQPHNHTLGTVGKLFLETCCKTVINQVKEKLPSNKKLKKLKMNKKKQQRSTNRDVECILKPCS